MPSLELLGFMSEPTRHSKSRSPFRRLWCPPCLWSFSYRPICLTTLGLQSTALLFILFVWMAVASGQTLDTLKIFPEQIQLASPEATDQIVVLHQRDDHRTEDLTAFATYHISDPSIATISISGHVTPLKDGRGEIRIVTTHGEVILPVIVSGVTNPRPVSFRNQVLPILSKAGCNSGGCHGKAEGQNGFKLSVFGYDAAADYDALVRDARSRRIFPASPENSLLLTKATGKLPHGGGIRIDPGSRWHRRLLRWTREGMPLDVESGNSVVSIQVQPSEILMDARGIQQLRVDAISPDGDRQGVTAEADFQSNNDGIAAVNRAGLIEATDIPGEAAILVRYMGHVAICRVTRPRPAAMFHRPAENNFVDQLIWNKLEQLNIQPSDSADDATFLRRAFLDVIGTLPTSAETREFLHDSSTDKRQKLIDRLLSRPEYADYWSQKWTDLLQVDKDIVGAQSAMAMSRWVRNQFQHNVPFDQFARQILTAEGSTLAESPAAFFQVQSDPEKSARAVSQLFLGVRIECAQCHHHPFEKWDRSDYYAWAGLFTGVDRRPAASGSMKIVAKHIQPFKHPASGELVALATLGDAPLELSPTANTRRILANWLTQPDNPYFSRTIANRLFSHFFGRGLVEPIDDLRVTNPASNEALLDALAQHLIDLKYDQKAFIRTLMMSQAYQLSAQPNDANRLDDQNYSHAAWKPISAEVLLDAVSQVTEIPEQFDGWPAGYRAIQLWDNKLPSHFLQVFGRPTRQTVCACERGTEPSIAQALHLMNSETTTSRIENSNGIVARLTASSLSDSELIDELFLTALTRFPKDSERTLMIQTLANSESRRGAVEDILWTLLNTREFVFNH